MPMAAVRSIKKPNTIAMIDIVVVVFSADSEWIELMAAPSPKNM